MDDPLGHLTAGARLAVRLLITAASIAIPNGLIWITIVLQPR